MNLNKINAEVYQEIINDLYCFIELNPESLNYLYDYTPIQNREGYTKYDNPMLYADMFDYAVNRGVVERTVETRKTINPLPEIFNDDTPLALNPFGGESDFYKIKIDKARLDTELSELVDSTNLSADNLVAAKLLLKAEELRVESEYGVISIGHLRRGLSPYQFLEYVLNAKANQLVTRSDLEKNGIHLSDTLTEVLRKSGINKALKSHFVPESAAGFVRIVPETNLSRREWNGLIASTRKR